MATVTKVVDRVREMIERALQGPPPLSPEDLGAIQREMNQILPALGTAACTGLYLQGATEPLDAGTASFQDRCCLKELALRLEREGHPQKQIAAAVFSHILPYDLEVRDAYGLPEDLDGTWRWVMNPN